jgi:ubiquinone/menaquinone biosynthesis C-methylase UbiE
MILTRYGFAAEMCKDHDVLEIASGPGMGLGYLAKRARRIVGSDYTECFLHQAHQHYRGRINLVRLDAHALPFPEDIFDVVVFFEAIYYLQRPVAFLEECRRVLRPNGVLLVCTVNPRWLGFHPSPLSVQYFSAHELERVLRTARFDTQMFAAFPQPSPTLGHTAMLYLRRLAVRLELIPRTMKRKELLKRLVAGPLVALPDEIMDDHAAKMPIVALEGDTENGQYKVLFAIARKNDSR